jgi:hypothetical protein
MNKDHFRKKMSCPKAKKLPREGKTKAYLKNKYRHLLNNIAFTWDGPYK